MQREMRVTARDCRHKLTFGTWYYSDIHAVMGDTATTFATIIAK